MSIILDEKTTKQLISQSQNGNDYKTMYGNRYTNRLSVSVGQINYNKIDMNNLFRKDSLLLEIPIHGKTRLYKVFISIRNLIKTLPKDKEIEFKDVFDALMKCMQDENIYIYCTCPDATYRFNYWSTKYDYNAGPDQFIPARITNPENNLGAYCKHSLAVLSNLNWLQKTAIAINNYINWLRKNRYTTLSRLNLK